jgi:hypothetical protein
MYYFSVLLIICVTLPPGIGPIAVGNKYIYIYNIYIGVEHPCGTCDQILLPVVILLSEICGLLSVGRPL